MRRKYNTPIEDVFNAIDGERDYQESRWNPETTTSEGYHSASEWYSYIEDYVAEARHILAREPDQIATPKAMNIMRKVAAMAVCAMEQNGAPERAGYERNVPTECCGNDCGCHENKQ